MQLPTPMILIALAIGLGSCTREQAGCALVGWHSLGCMLTLKKGAPLSVNS